jgi:glycosyltransferase involved in cell wall biosynthesis
VALHEEPLPEYEKVENFSVHRIKLKTRNWSKHTLVQVIKYIEFLFLAIRKYRKICIFHCNDLGALPVGVLIKLFFNKAAKVIYDAHEYETERDGLSGLEKHLTRWLEARLIKQVDRVLTVSDSIADEYARLYGIDKPNLVLNCLPYLEVQKQDRFRETFNISEDQTIFLYQGGLSRGRGIELLLQAFSGLLPITSVIVFMGYGPLEQNIKAYAGKYPNIYFHPAVSQDVLLNYTASADYGVLFYENTCLNHYYCSPNKIFEYLMAGIPVLTANLFEMKRLVEEYQVGIVASENTLQGLQWAVEQADNLNYQELVGNVHAARRIFNWEAQEKILLKMYREL